MRLSGGDQPGAGRLLGPPRGWTGKRGIRGKSHPPAGRWPAARRTPAAPAAPPRRTGRDRTGTGHTGRRPGKARRGHYLSEHLAAAVSLPRRGVGYNPGDLGGGVGVLVLVLVRRLLLLLLRLLPAGLAAGRSAQRRLAALGGAAAAAATAPRRVGDGPQQLHHRVSPAPSCLPARSLHFTSPCLLAPLPPLSRHPAARRFLPYIAGGGSAPALTDGPRHRPAPPARPSWPGPGAARGEPGRAGPTSTARPGSAAVAGGRRSVAGRRGKARSRPFGFARQRAAAAALPIAARRVGARPGQPRHKGGPAACEAAGARERRRVLWGVGAAPSHVSAAAQEEGREFFPAVPEQLHHSRETGPGFYPGVKLRPVDLLRHVRDVGVHAPVPRSDPVPASARRTRDTPQGCLMTVSSKILFSRAETFPSTSQMHTN